MGDTAPSSTRQLLGLSLRDDRYVISGIIGSGSQGATVEAVDKRDGQLVAIKRFQVRGARSWKDVELAEREARVLSKLSHRLLPRAIEHFEEDGALYLVMERIEGDTLASLGTISRDEVVRFLHNAAEILDYLHGQSPPVIHRDIKPSNAIRRPPRPDKDELESTFVLVDFGSVRDNLKPAGGSTVVGTFGYMAPEQFQGRALPASDVYAVGVCALRMLTGVEPEDLPHKGLAINVEAALGRGDPALVRTLVAMVEPDPDQRAHSIGPLLAALAPPRGNDHPPGGHRVWDQEQPKRPETTRHSPRTGRPDPAPQPVGAAPGPSPSSFEGGPSTIYLPPPIRAAVVIALTIAEIVVLATASFAVPVLLTLMSLIFGRGMRQAAGQVRAASQRARQAIRQTQHRFQGETPWRRRSGHRGRWRGRRRRRGWMDQQADAPTPPPEPPRAEQPEVVGQRFEEPVRPTTTRSRIEESVTDTLAEMEEALEEAIGDAEAPSHKPRRKDRRDS